MTIIGNNQLLNNGTMNIRITEFKNKQSECQSKKNSQCTIHSTDNKMYTDNQFNYHFNPVKDI